jgi:hypothetical protein
MKQPVTTRRKFISGAAASVLILAIVATPAGRSMLASALLDFVEINEKVVRLPCRNVDNSRCLSLDRFDPTCPQCM